MRSEVNYTKKGFWIGFCFGMVILIIGIVFVVNDILRLGPEEAFRIMSLQHHTSGKIFYTVILTIFSMLIGSVLGWIIEKIKR